MAIEDSRFTLTKVKARVGALDAHLAKYMLPSHAVALSFLITFNLFMSAYFMAPCIFIIMWLVPTHT